MNQSINQSKPGAVDATPKAAREKGLTAAQKQVAPQRQKLPNTQKEELETVRLRRREVPPCGGATSVGVVATR